MSVDGEEMKQHYGEDSKQSDHPQVKARRRKPTPGEVEAHVYEVKRALYGPTFNEAEYVRRQNEENSWPQQPGKNEKPKFTPWQQGPGVPSTMVPNPEAGGMAYERPPGDEPGLLTRYRQAFSPSRIASAVQQAFSRHVNRQLGVRAVKYALARPKQLLQYALLFGGSAYILYQNWDTIGYYFNLVMQTLNYFKSGEAYAEANRQGEAYMDTHAPNATRVQYNTTGADGNVTSTTLIDAVMTPEDALNVLFEVARGDALKKIWLDEAINQTVTFASNSTNAAAPPVYEAPPEPEMYHPFSMEGYRKDFREASKEFGEAVTSLSMGVFGMFRWGLSGNDAVQEDIIMNPLQT